MMSWGKAVDFNNLRRIGNQSYAIEACGKEKCGYNIKGRTFCHMKIVFTMSSLKP